MVSVAVGHLRCMFAHVMGQVPKVFNWDRAAYLIRERKAQSARAGLSDDME
jgi:hypothetical protein